MLVIIIIAVILGVIAGLVSAIFGLDFETVFIWCVLSVCGLGLLLLLNPIVWKGYIREQRHRRERAERAREAWQELNALEMADEDWDDEFDRMIDRSVDEYVRYTPWTLNIFTGNYDRTDRMTGRQECISASEYEEWKDNHIF